MRFLPLLAACAPDPAQPGPAPSPAPAPGLVQGARLDFDEALGPCMDAELADLDGDTDLDVVLAMEFSHNVVLWNDGHAVFTPETLPGRAPQPGVPGTDSEEVAALDVEGDGDLDLLFVNEDLGGGGELHLRDGGKWLEASSGLPAPGAFQGMDVADLDGDGKLEVVIAAYGPEVVWSLDGRGGLVDVTADWLAPVDDRSQDVELADLDKDGDLDLVVANENGDSRLLLQEGGRFVPAPFPTAEDEESREIDAGDLDGDGDLDLMVANVGWAAGPSQDRWLLNDGAAGFVEGPPLPADRYETLDADLVDVDADGDLDVLRANSDIVSNQLVPAPFEIWLAEGGEFTRADESFVPWMDGLWLDVEAGDLDGDGLLDVYLCARGTRDAILLGRS
jgi:hypothetical protein